MAGLYRVLGVESHASAGEIREAYKRQVLIHHPDKGGSAKAFRLVKLAYETLSSVSNRNVYNQHVGVSQRVSRWRRGTRLSRRPLSTVCQSRRGSTCRARCQSTTSVTEPLGASAPVKTRERGGRRARAVLLRSLRKLYLHLAVRPAEQRRELLRRLSVPLQQELTAFIAHQKALGVEITTLVSQRHSSRLASASPLRFYFDYRYCRAKSSRSRCRQGMVFPARDFTCQEASSP